MARDVRGIALPLALFGLALVPVARAQAPPLVASVTATIGAAPLRVTLSASEGAGSYRWEFGDGAVAEGRVVEHTYTAPRAYAAVVTATYADGHVARAEVVVTAYRLTLAAPASTHYREPRRFRAALVPPLAGATVVLRGPSVAIATGRTGRDGKVAFRTRVTSPGPYTARFKTIASAPRSVLVRPALDARLAGSPTVGEPLRLVVRLRPRGAGALAVRVMRDGRVTYSQRRYGSAQILLHTGQGTSYRIGVSLHPKPGYARVTRRLTTTVIEPQLALGSRGPGVRELERRLAELRYALARVDGLYGLDTYEAVLAFQKLSGLPWTGRVDRLVWQRLLRARTPAARYPGDHIEVSKSRQVLFVVRKGRVERIVHVSTGATGNTPIGRWRVYRKVIGWDGVLWYPLYFLRGFAIHGYPSVPAYPASHGCVRVPMWVAPSLFARNAYGTTVIVY